MIAGKEPYLEELLPKVRPAPPGFAGLPAEVTQGPQQAPWQKAQDKFGTQGVR